MTKSMLMNLQLSDRPDKAYEILFRYLLTTQERVERQQSSRMDKLEELMGELLEALADRIHIPKTFTVSVD
jgi:hypothetical protein